MPAGLDWGGVSREFFERLCVELFDPSNHLFRRFNEENQQALVSCRHVHVRYMQPHLFLCCRVLPRIFQGIAGGHGLGGVCEHIKTFWLPYYLVWNVLGVLTMSGQVSEGRSLC